ncbi:MAG: TonB-dependent receptor [Kangiellaceae bacterium]|jgi:iron complex outermembrane receptor protein|nr:TonB-dependent receptor [Kangiellaceae bacterium]
MNLKFAALLIVSSLGCIADDSGTVIEILAPKDELGSSMANHTSSYLDDRFTFNLNRTIADQLIFLPGINLNGQGGQFQSFSIRGFSRSRIRTEVDGIPIITDRRAGNSVSFIAPDLIGLGRVIKGPSSALYGSQALGGVVSLSTENFGSSFIMSNQLRNQALNLTLTHQSNDLSAGVAYQSSDNDFAADGTELNTEFERFSAVLRYQKYQDGLQTTISWLPSWGKDIGKSNVDYPSSELSVYPEEQHSLAQIQINSDSGWLVKLFHHYQNWDSETIDIGQLESLIKYQSHTLGGQWLSEFTDEDFTSYLGIDWLSRQGVDITSQYQLLNQQPVIDSFASRVFGSEDNWAIYNKSRWQFESVNLDIGVRYDWINQQSDGQQDIFDSQLNASFSFDTAISEQLRLTAEFANGFRYPTLSERYFNGRTPRGFIQGNQQLNPETSVGSQLAISWATTKRLAVSASLYHYDLDNYIERYRVDTDTLSFRNVSEARIEGFDAEINWYWNDNIEHYITYQQQSGYDAQGNRLADLIPKQLNWIMLLNYQEWSIANALSHQFDTDQVHSTELQRDDFTLWNISLNCRINSQQTVSFIISNVFNEDYFASLDSDAAQQPEREFRLALSWSL